jgi:hypothetical protein
MHVYVDKLRFLPGNWETATVVSTQTLSPRALVSALGSPAFRQPRPSAPKIIIADWSKSNLRLEGQRYKNE